MNYSPRVGVSVTTEKGNNTYSTFQVQKVTLADSGEYLCNSDMGSRPRVMVHVIKGVHHSFGWYIIYQTSDTHYNKLSHKTKQKRKQIWKWDKENLNFYNKKLIKNYIERKIKMKCQKLNSLYPNWNISYHEAWTNMNKV